ncbi:MAG: aminotransferase class I/II-fold pyridoxal phosphate-dependent enzyme, partial [Clostridiales bacterium]|nr:aminotransferase class I/II-fold pyridoxal phosphate-dependent enzyme [Clostridiales bacterium]
MREWEKNLRKVVPYVPGEQPKGEGIIKLNTNENPYPHSPKVMEQLDVIKDLQLYPDPAAHLLTEAIARRFHVKEEQVFVGVGSDDVLAMAFMTFFHSKKPIFFP